MSIRLLKSLADLITDTTLENTALLKYIFTTLMTYEKLQTPGNITLNLMGCWQCLPLSVVQLKGKHCRKPHCPNGVVDTFGL